MLRVPLKFIRPEFQYQGAGTAAVVIEVKALAKTAKRGRKDYSLTTCTKRGRSNGYLTPNLIVVTVT